MYSVHAASAHFEWEEVSVMAYRHAAGPAFVEVGLGLGLGLGLRGMVEGESIGRVRIGGRWAGWTDNMKYEERVGLKENEREQIHRTERAMVVRGRTGH